MTFAIRNSVTPSAPLGSGDPEPPEIDADDVIADLPLLRAEAARQERNARFRRLAMRSLSLLLLFGLWWGASAFNRYLVPTVNPNLLPGPPAVLAEGVRLWQAGTLQRDILASLVRVLEGFAIASVGGIVIGTLVARVGWIGDLFEPIIDVLRPIPPLAFLPLIVLYLGIGDISKVSFIAYAAFFPIFTTSREGMKYVDPILIRAARSLGATQRQILWHVVVPSAIPSVLTGLRLGLGLSFFVIIAAEFIAASEGLGYLINDAREFFRVDRMLLGASIIGILGYGFTQMFGQLERRLQRWRR